MRHVYTLEPGRPTPGRHNLLRPPIASLAGAGILTRFPSATTFVLALGADSPCADTRGAGNLGLTATRTFTWFIATHVSIRTSDTSSSGLPPPSPAYGTLSYHSVRSPSTPQRPPRLRRAGASTWLNAVPARRLRARRQACWVERTKSTASVHSLSPVTSSAQDDSTSELLRFL